MTSASQATRQSPSDPPAMPLPRVRFTMRRMMIGVAALVAIFGFSFWFLIWRSHQQHHEWYRDIEMTFPGSLTGGLRG